MEDVLKKITDIIDTYNSGTWVSLDDLRVMLRELRANIYYLTKYNIEYFEKHNAVQYRHKGSVSAGVILANEQFPELRMTRKIIDSANNVAMAVTMEISIIKTEK
tara:strand:+ start:6403 stop:6717 length:315 start_codon:yes stop_codon:yes gene_type:complete